MCLQKGPFFAIFLNEGGKCRLDEMIIIMISSFLFLYDVHLLFEFYVHCLESTNVCKMLCFFDKRAILSIIKYTDNLF